jgi:hypothetical protein
LVLEQPVGGPSQCDGIGREHLGDNGGTAGCERLSAEVAGQHAVGDTGRHALKAQPLAGLGSAGAGADRATDAAELAADVGHLGLIGPGGFDAIEARCQLGH